MGRVPLTETAFKKFGVLTLIVGLCVVLIIYPILDIVESNREITQNNDRDSGLTNWDQERETGYLLVTAAMTVGQVMVFIGLIMLVTGRVKAYMHSSLFPKVVQCGNCQTMYDIKWPRCPKCDKPIMDTPYSEESKPHIIKVAALVSAERQQ